MIEHMLLPWGTQIDFFSIDKLIKRCLLFIIFCTLVSMQDFVELKRVCETWTLAMSRRGLLWIIFRPNARLFNLFTKLNSENLSTKLFFKFRLYIIIQIIFIQSFPVVFQALWLTSDLSLIRIDNLYDLIFRKDQSLGGIPCHYGQETLKAC